MSDNITPADKLRVTRPRYDKKLFKLSIYFTLITIVYWYLSRVLSIFLMDSHLTASTEKTLSVLVMWIPRALPFISSMISFVSLMTSIQRLNEQRKLAPGVLLFIFNLYLLYGLSSFWIYY